MNRFETKVQRILKGNMRLYGMTSWDDKWFDNKYGYYGISSRREWFLVKDEAPELYKDICDNIIERQKFNNTVDDLFNEKNIGCINGSLLKPVKGSGPKGGGPNGGDPPDIDNYITPEQALEDIIKFDYEYMFLRCLKDKNKQFMNRIYDILFNRYLWNEKQKEIYINYEITYNEDKKNGNLAKINEFVLRLSRYCEEKKLKNDKSYVDGGVIVYVGLIISEYIKTGILDTDIKRFEKYTIEELNEYYNTYVIFLLLNIFTCKRRKVKMTVEGKVVRELWFINLIRRRFSNKIYRTTCVLPRFDRDKYGNIVLYCDTYDSDEGMDEP